jgi:hypothetical protein
MGNSVAFQILDYPGAQKSAQWGMKDQLDYSNSQAENLAPRYSQLRTRHNQFASPWLSSYRKKFVLSYI